MAAVFKYLTETLVMIGWPTGSRIYARMAWLRMRRGRMVWVAVAMFALPLLYVGRAGHRRPLGPRPLRRRVRALLPLPHPVRAGADGVGGGGRGDREQDLHLRLRAAGAARRAGPRQAVGGDAAGDGSSWCRRWRSRGWWRSCASPPTWPRAGRTFCASSWRRCLGLCAYAALAAAMGTLFSRHPLVAVLVYLMLVEEGLGSAPIVLNLDRRRVAPAQRGRAAAAGDGVHGADVPVVGLRRSLAWR